MAPTSSDFTLHRQMEEWKQSAQHMYERLDVISLEWPTLTAQWMPNDKEGNSALVATYSAGKESEFIREVCVDTDKFMPEKHLIEEYFVEKPEIMAAKAYRDIIVGFRANGDILVYKQGEKQPRKLLQGYISNDNDETNTLESKTEQKGGYGLCFNPIETEDIQFVTGSESGSLILWSVDSDLKQHQICKSIDFQQTVNDVSWTYPDRIIVSFESGEVAILDRNLKLLKKVKFEDEVMSASLNPFAEDILLVASNGIKVVDIKLRTGSETGETSPEFSEFHLLYENPTTTELVKWSPTRDGIFATAGESVMYIWSLEKVGDEQSYEDSLDGPPELLFKHLGHVDGFSISAFDWHPKIDMLLLSADGKNSLISWQPNKESLNELKAPQMPKNM